MKNFIYLFFLCLMATSCENAMIEEENPTTTRATPQELGYYGTYFMDVKSEQTKWGLEHMYGYVEVYPATGVEYKMRLATSMTESGIRSAVSIAGGRIIHNGVVDNRIYGESNGYVDFTIQFTSSRASVSLNLERTASSFYDNRVSSRLVIMDMKYNGESLPYPGDNGGYSDLNVYGTYP